MPGGGHAANLPLRYADKIRLCILQNDEQRNDHQSNGEVVRSMIVELEPFDFHHGFARVEASPGADFPQAGPI
jgi:hypothetical protein